jgi:SAM-dependent methyltransferase
MLSLLKKINRKFRKELKLQLHKGDKYVCPFCGYSSKDLAPIGLELPVLKEKQVIGGGKRNAGCYNCGSTDRERLIYTYLKEVEKIFNNGAQLKILHIAPEKNLSLIILKSSIKEYVCGDLFTEGYSYPSHVKNISILDIPFPENYFDLVICNHVLEHIPNDNDAIKELNRVLKVGGKAILQVPISKNSQQTFEDFSVTTPEQREIVFGQFDHVRIYGQDYEQRLHSGGFEVNRINISKDFPKNGLNPQEDLFIGQKVIS